MMRRVIIPFLVLLAISLSSNAHAKGEAGAQFLKMGVGARACAMGEAFVGIADDASAIYWNPAGLAQIKSVQLLGMQNFWLMDMGYQYLGIVLPSGYGNFGAAVTYSSSGQIPRYENFQQIGEYTAYDGACNLAYAIGQTVSFGINLKAIRQKIEEEDATGFAADIGLLCKVTKGMNIGLTLQNLGTGTKFIKEADPLPQTGKIGIGCHRGPLVFAVDYGKSRDNDACVNAGGEFVIGKIVALRAGYNSANSYSAGLGLTWKRVSIDYAYVPYEELGDTHRVSFLVKFGSAEEIRPIVTPSAPPKKASIVIPEEIPDEDTTKITPKKPEQTIPVTQHVKAPPAGTTPEVIVPEKGRQVTVIIDKVNVLSGPGSSYEKIAIVGKGTKLMLLDDSRKWYYKVLLPDGRTGWINYAFVSE